MDTDDVYELEFAIDNAQTITITTCFELAASTLFLYDYILTIRQEVNCIWRRPKSLASVLFILCRYIVLAERMMMTVVVVYVVPMRYSIAGLVDSVSTATIQADIYNFVVCFSSITVIILHSALAVFAAVRVYAIWQKNVFLGGLVLILGLVYPAYVIVTLVGSIGSSFLDDFYPDTLLTSEPPVPFFFFIISICNECLVVALTWSKTIGVYRVTRRSNVGTTKSLSYLLLRDGTMYFMDPSASVALSIMGIVLSLNFSSAFQPSSTCWCPTPTHPTTQTDKWYSCPGVLITRFILNLRQDAVPATGELSDGRADLHSIVFAAQGSSRLIGNIGASTYAPGDWDESDDE
ncbi:hypothetical protein BDW22DRAFT_1423868 [Trametopsis cervina]|nr:hypothetical protein BDW22DRAFT_1423868 [Trametopsis cervina]